MLSQSKSPPHRGHRPCCSVNIAICLLNVRPYFHLRACCISQCGFFATFRFLYALTYPRHFTNTCSFSSGVRLPLRDMRSSRTQSRHLPRSPSVELTRFPNSLSDLSQPQCEHRLASGKVVWSLPAIAPLDTLFVLVEAITPGARRSVTHFFFYGHHLAVHDR